jgi:hypothetical protein
LVALGTGAKKSSTPLTDQIGRHYTLVPWIFDC